MRQAPWDVREKCKSCGKLIAFDTNGVSMGGKTPLRPINPNGTRHFCSPRKQQ